MFRIPSAGRLYDNSTGDEISLYKKRFICIPEYARSILLKGGQTPDADILALNTRLQEEKAKRLLLENDVNFLTAQVQDLKRRFDTYVRDTNPTEISHQAFMVRLTKNIYPGNNQRIIYDKVIVNLGNNYDPRHGTFTATINGTYLFTVEACSSSNHFITLALQKNSVEMGVVLAGDTAYVACSSNTFVFPLVSGDDVWVQHRNTTGDYLHGQFDGTNFAGTLINSS